MIIVIKENLVALLIDMERPGPFVYIFYTTLLEETNELFQPLLSFRILVTEHPNSGPKMLLWSAGYTPESAVVGADALWMKWESGPFRMHNYLNQIIGSSFTIIDEIVGKNCC